jgi:hypothetical protein
MAMGKSVNAHTRPPHCLMALLLVSVHCLCWWFVGLSPSQPWPSFDCAHWSSAAPLNTQPGDHSSAHPMPKHKERLRGRPRRGSPWRPRRPSFSPPASPPTGSSIHPQAEPHSLTSLNPPTMNFNCLELIPRLPSSSLRLLLRSTGE